MKTAQLMDHDYSDDRSGERTPAPARDTVVPILPVTAAPVAQPAHAPAVARPVTAANRLVGWVRGHLGDWLLAAVSIGTVLLLWELATRFRLDFYIRFNNIPTPAEVFDKVIEVNRSTKFITSIGISVRRIVLGFLVACALGISLGILIGRYRRARQLFMPALEVFRPIPAIAWVPMAIMLWPTNEVSIVFITFLGAFFPILLNTVHGVQAIDPVLLRAARSLGAKEMSLLTQVVLPGALPHIFTGLAVGMGVAWVSLIAAEMISGQFGVLGLLCSGAIRLVARIAMPWTAFSAKAGRS